MSNKVPEEIDLNCDAVPVHQENERSDVNVGQPVSGLATTETVLAAGLDELEKESKIESVKSQGIDLEADVGSLGGGGGGGAGAGDGKSGSMEDKKPVEDEQMVPGSTGGVTEELNVSASPNEDSLIEGTSVRSSSLADSTIHSGDGKPLTSAVQSCLPDEDQKMSSKEKEVSSGERDSQDAENSNQTTSTYEDESSDVDAKPEEPEFCDSDLVWGKVRSHPWWPGQIFDSSAATAKAKKYFKKESYLIAYYGDQTFAWNEASQIKPFRSHFSHMEKKTNMEEFHHAVDCALDEVSRRVEFGLACSCISEKAYSQIKTEIIVNAGIREESSRRDGWDRFSSASSFDPLELVKTMKKLARSPSYTNIYRLQFTISQAQLLAFHRWKGYSQLPEFQNLCGSLETDAAIPLSEEMKKCSKLIKKEIPSVKVDERVYSEEEELDTQYVSSSKQKKIRVSGKKEKSLSEFIAERRLSLQIVKRKLNKKGDDKSMSSSPAKKLKAVDPVCNDLAMKQNKNNLSTASVDKPLQSKQTFGVGASILRVASQLNDSIFSTPLLKHTDGKSRKAAVGNKSKGKSSSGKSRGKKVPETDISSSDKMLSQLHLAATDPLKGNQPSSSLPGCLSSPQSKTPLKHAAVDENLGMEAEDRSPTSLILKFSDIDTVPAVEELNKVFSRYGPLITRGTEVFRKSIQAKVVFKRRTDAMAFSSSGKYSIFGPSLVSYRLKPQATGFHAK
ncbi:Tudor/PWWP/MBT superfamily protein, putative isoform 4 [Hibiscus syriacus]|uniref:Tudor/PWWP/MBT superfamily protein, putative isoform 4 n=1 Tax=Hibiscus syriacus TaxID=106335 RepID=A0A6A3BL76_HIBSY|nr:Tudor/PWWP/MBT superfamily protein, putative isoform 4 [Hibiscus syriacus]